MADFAGEKEEFLWKFLSLDDGLPSHDTPERSASNALDARAFGDVVPEGLRRPWTRSTASATSPVRSSAKAAIMPLHSKAIRRGRMMTSGCFWTIPRPKRSDRDPDIRHLHRDRLAPGKPSMARAQSPRQNRPTPRHGSQNDQGNSLLPPQHTNFRRAPRARRQSPLGDRKHAALDP
jgi:hypothetical protein